jgi:hypothetical protein
VAQWLLSRKEKTKTKFHRNTVFFPFHHTHMKVKLNKNLIFINFVMEQNSEPSIKWC